MMSGIAAAKYFFAPKVSVIFFINISIVPFLFLSFFISVVFIFLENTFFILKIGRYFSYLANTVLFFASCMGNLAIRITHTAGELCRVDDIIGKKLND